MINVNDAARRGATLAGRPSTGGASAGTPPQSYTSVMRPHPPKASPALQDQIAQEIRADVQQAGRARNAPAASQQQSARPKAEPQPVTPDSLTNIGWVDARRRDELRTERGARAEDPREPSSAASATTAQPPTQNEEQTYVPFSDYMAGIMVPGMEFAGGRWIPEPKWGYDLMGRPLPPMQPPIGLEPPRPRPAPPPHPNRGEELELARLRREAQRPDEVRRNYYANPRPPGAPQPTTPPKAKAPAAYTAETPESRRRNTRNSDRSSRSRSERDQQAWQHRSGA